MFKGQWSCFVLLRWRILGRLHVFKTWKALPTSKVIRYASQKYIHEIRYNREGRPNHSAPSIRRSIYWKAKGWTQTGLTFESRKIKKMRINVIKPAVSVALHICTCQGSSDIMHMWPSNQCVLVVTPQENIFSLVTSSVGLLEDCIMHDIRYDIDSGDGWC